MDWTQTLSIIATVVGGVYYVHRDLKQDMQYIRRDIKEDMATQTARTDKLYEIFTETMKSQTARTDKLYEMFIDLLKKKSGD
jgi:hypothetical protein